MALRGETRSACWLPAEIIADNADSIQAADERLASARRVVNAGPLSVSDVLVSAEQLSCHFDVSASLVARLITGAEKRVLKAVDQVTLDIRRGETFALVGESGCGKSTIARLMAGLYEPTSGRLEVSGADGAAPRVQMIFQDPYASLNPRWRVEDIIAEPIRAVSRSMSRAEIRQRVGELLEQVKLSPKDAQKYPHEFSGGQRQRISIARALAGDPEFLICDEPTSALDVSVQAQVLNLMKDLQRQFGLTYLIISHNLAVVRHVADRIGVMYLGKVVESANADDFFAEPAHPYSRLLLDSVPDLNGPDPKRGSVASEIPNPMSPPSGCPFHPRCAYANDRCRAEPPGQSSRSAGWVTCHAWEEERLPYMATSAEGARTGSSEMQGVMP